MIKAFQSARIKLTAWYLLVIMTLSISMSASVYNQVVITADRALIFHEQKIQNRLKDMNPRNDILPLEEFQKPINAETVQDIKEHTLFFLILLNGLLFIVAGGLGYFLAGKTLIPIEEMVDKQKKFIADAAHEIKTPLTAMKTTLEVQLRNKNLNLEQARKSMETVLEEVDELTSLSIKLLDESKYKESKNDNEKFLFGEVIENIIKIFEGRILAENLSVQKNIDEKIYIKGNKKSIKELISILFDNSIKFNNKDGKININLYSKRDLAVFEITNTGKEIPEKDLSKIFDRFYKVDKSRAKNNKDGYGLGLSIAKEIVSVHQGQIEVESKNGETKFKIYIKRA